MVYKIPPGGGGKPYLASGLITMHMFSVFIDSLVFHYNSRRHDKTYLYYMRTTKAQISLRLSAA